MDFPETDCEKRVLQHLGLPIDYAIPFGIMQYIHVACRAGFYYEETASRVARLLNWASILKKINSKYPNLIASDEIESGLKGAYLQYGSGLKFLSIFGQYLIGSQRYAKEASALNKKQTKDERKGRQQAWADMIVNAPPVRSLPFREELEIDVELFFMPINKAQQELVAKAAEEKNLLKDKPHAYGPI